MELLALSDLTISDLSAAEELNYGSSIDRWLWMSYWQLDGYGYYALIEMMDAMLTIMDIMLKDGYGCHADNQTVMDAMLIDSYGCLIDR